MQNKERDCGMGSTEGDSSSVGERENSPAGVRGDKTFGESDVQPDTFETDEDLQQQQIEGNLGNERVRNREVTPPSGPGPDPRAPHGERE
jgi:hypothetical protein